MSQASGLQPPSKPSDTREPRPLSTEYHKSHKQLMLWSTILFIWELIGVDLEKARDVGGNVGPVVTALKSPQAIPWVLVILVLYFSFKCSIEWAQCQAERRSVRFARIDFISAWVVSVSAIFLYLGQAVARVQLANSPNFHPFLFLLLAWYPVIIGTFIYIIATQDREKRLHWRRTVLLPLAASVLLLTAVLSSIERLKWPIAAALGVCGLIGSVLQFFVLPKKS